MQKPPGFDLKVSPFHCTLDKDFTVVKSQMLRDGVGGAHEVFWNILSLCLNEKSTNLIITPLSERDRNVVISKLALFRENLSALNAPMFGHLSAVRNNIQYRHEFNIWLPHVIKKPDRQNLSRLLLQWKRDLMDIELDAGQEGDLQRFTITCAFLICLCVSLFRRIENISKNPVKSFAHRSSTILYA
jgi:hypothetical protein